jgi:hypothetical protein
MRRTVRRRCAVQWFTTKSALDSTANSCKRSQCPRPSASARPEGNVHIGVEANSERIRLRVSGSGFSTMSNTPHTHGRSVTGAPELNP